MKRQAVIRQCEQRDRDPSKPIAEQKVCLYTKDGKELLGRHPDAEAAKAQEAAIHAGATRAAGTTMPYIRLAEVPESAIKSLYDQKWGEGIMQALGEEFPLDSKAAQFLFHSVWNAVIQLMDATLQQQHQVDTTKFAEDPTFMQSLAGLAYFVTDDAIKSSLGLESDSLQKGAGHAEALMAVLGKEADVSQTLQGLQKRVLPIVEKAFDQVTSYLKQPEQKAAGIKHTSPRELFCAFVRLAQDDVPLTVDEVMEFYRDVDEGAVAYLVDQYNRGVRPADYMDFLRTADEILENHGVEAVNLGPDAERWQLDYDEAVIADFSNTGDSYHPTFLWDIEKEEMLWTGWADFLERWERERQKELGDEYRSDEDFYGAAVQKTAAELDLQFELVGGELLVRTQSGIEYSIDPNDKNKFVLALRTWYRLPHRQRISRDQYEVLGTQFGIDIYPDNDLGNYADEFGNYDFWTYGWENDLLDRPLRQSRWLGLEQERKSVRRDEKIDEVGESIVKPTGQLWEPCERCGREPSYMPLHLCQKCWPSEFKRAAVQKTADGWDKLPKGWTKKSVQKFWDGLTGDRKHKVTACIKKMEGKVEDAGAFCAALAGEIPAMKGWRSEPRKGKTALSKSETAPTEIPVARTAMTSPRIVDRMVRKWAAEIPRDQTGYMSVWLYPVVAMDASAEEWVINVEAEGLYIPAASRNDPYIQEFLQEELNDQLTGQLDQETEVGHVGSFVYTEQGGYWGLIYETPAIEEVLALIGPQRAATQVTTEKPAEPVVQPVITPSTKPASVLYGGCVYRAAEQTRTRTSARQRWGRIRSADLDDTPKTRCGCRTTGEEKMSIRTARDQPVLPGIYEEVIDVDPNWSSMGKFDHFVGEVVYGWLLDGGGSEILGDVETFGHFDLIEVSDLVLVREPDGEEWTFTSAILHTDNQGFVSVAYYDTLEEGRDEWDQLEQEYAEWLDEFDDEYEASVRTSETIENDPSYPGIGKFDTNIDEHVHGLVLDGWSTEVLGDTEDLGYFDLVIFGLDDPLIVVDRDREDVFAAAIVSENDQGFVNVTYYEQEADAWNAWAGIEEDYAEFDQEVAQEVL